MPRLEKDIEDECAEYSEGHGVAALKINVPGQKGWPDRLFFGMSPTSTDFIIFFVEFKRPGELPTRLQLAKHRNIFRKY